MPHYFLLDYIINFLLERNFAQLSSYFLPRIYILVLEATAIAGIASIPMAKMHGNLYLFCNISIHVCRLSHIDIF